MDTSPTTSRIFILSLATLIIITLLRLYHLYYSPFDLFFDEAQYWDWSRNPQWGYYSKPPMIAWIITLTTSACGNSEFCIRLGSPLLHLLTAGIIYLTGKQLYSPLVGILSAVTYFTLPGISLSSSLISTDPLLLFFWALALYTLVKILKSPASAVPIHWWFLAGVVGGLGMLSKYTMGVFFLSAIFYMLCTPALRDHFHTRGFALAFLTGLLVFSPNIMWNWSYDFVSFLHTRDNANLGEDITNPIKFLEFFFSQFGVFGPLTFASLLYFLWCYLSTASTERKEEDRLLWYITLPLFLIILAISFLSRAHANWAAPIYIPATLLVVSGWCQRQRYPLITTSLTLHFIILAVFMNLYPFLHSLGFSISGTHTSLRERVVKDPMRRMHGWQVFGEKAKALFTQYPEAIPLTIDRKIHTELLYYATPFADKAVKWNPNNRIGDHYDLTRPLHQFSHSHYILITDYPFENLSHFFTSAKQLPDLIVPLYEDYEQHFNIYYLGAFKG